MERLIEVLNASAHRLRMLALLCLAASVAACTGPDPNLGVTPDAEQAQSEPATIAALPPPPAGGSNVYFAPIVGAPVSKITPLSRRLSAAAESANVQLAPARAANLTHEIRGYFSALSEGDTTTVIHVWDVFTPDGQRVHRIQAQELVPGVADDPWSVVPDATMEQIADRLLTAYQNWRNSAQIPTTAPAQQG